MPLVLLVPVACARPDVPSCDPAAVAGPIAWVVDHGWHTEIGIPAAQATGKLAQFRTVFPEAKTLMFGFGKRSFITAKVETLADYVMGTIPGPGAIQVTELPVPPGTAFPGRTILLALPPGGAERLSEFLWRSIAPSQSGSPQPVGEGLFPGSAFYAASRGYTLLYTCNTWTADGLQQAGLPVDQDVIFASGTLNEVARIKGACLEASDDGAHHRQAASRSAAAAMSASGPQ